MEMKQCPNCGKQISDEASACLYCGYELISKEKSICVDCEKELEERLPIDSPCEAPIETTPPSLQSAEAIEAPKRSKKNKLLIGIGIIIVVAIIAILGVMKFQKQSMEKKYGENIESATLSMIAGASDAETCGNLIKRVWSDAIYEESDPETRKYTFAAIDFNQALENLFSDTTFSDQISAIKDNQSVVQSLMKELRNPPSKYEDAHKVLSEFYNAYINFTNLVISPSGSLQTFSSSFNSAQSNTLTCYNAMLIYLK